MKSIIKILLSGVFSQIINFLTIIYIAKLYGAEDFGYFSINIAIFSIMILFVDFGLNVFYVSSKTDETLTYGRIYIIKSIVCIFSLIFLFLSILLINDKNLHVYPFLFVGAAFSSLFQFHLIYYQLKREFYYYAILNISYYLIRGVVVVFLYYIKVDMSFFIKIFFLSNLFFSIIHIKFIKLYLNINEIKLIPTILVILPSKLTWVFFSGLSVALFMRIDVFFIDKYVGLTSVGIYSAAVQVAMVVPLFSVSLLTYTQSVLKEFKTDEDLFRYIIKLIYLMLLIQIVLQIVYPFTENIILLILGDSYNGIFVVLKILLIAYIFGVVANPISAFVHYFGLSKYFFLITFSQLLTCVFLNYVLVPLYFELGSAYTAVIIRVQGMLLMLIIIMKSKRFYVN